MRSSWEVVGGSVAARIGVVNPVVSAIFSLVVPEKLVASQLPSVTVVYELAADSELV